MRLPWLNVFEELPCHLKTDDKVIFTEALEVYKSEKERKRCCDKRKILLQMTDDLHYKIDGYVHQLLATLSKNFVLR